MRGKSRRAGRHPSLAGNFKPSPAAMQGFSVEGPVQATATRPLRAKRPDSLTFSTDLPPSLCSMRPFAGARPHGHPPLSLEAAIGGLFFTPTRAFLYSRGQSFRSSGSAAASAISPSVSIGPVSAARAAPAAASPCTGQFRSRSNGWSRPPCPGLGSGQVQPCSCASGEPGRGRSRPAAILLKPTGGPFVPCRNSPGFRLS